MSGTLRRMVEPPFASGRADATAALGLQHADAGEAAADVGLPPAECWAAALHLRKQVVALRRRHRQLRRIAVEGTVRGPKQGRSVPGDEEEHAFIADRRQKDGVAVALRKRRHDQMHAFAQPHPLWTRCANDGGGPGPGGIDCDLGLHLIGA